MTMSSAPFLSQLSISNSNNSSWIYLADWILALILALAFIFYFNRLFGFALSKILQFVLWKKFKVEISVESCRISFLGGRFFAKNLVVITSNETISVQHVNLTWRYWIVKQTRLPEYVTAKLKEESEKNNHTQIDESQRVLDEEENARLPTRFILLVDGLEVFMYNRTIAYDNMMDFLKQEELRQSQKNQKTYASNPKTEKEYADQEIRRRTSPSDTSTTTYTEKDSNQENMVTGTNSSSSSQHAQEGPNSKKCHPNDSDALTSVKNYLHFLLRILPLSIRIRKGAVVVGNSTTPTIMVASYRAANALFDISKAPCSLDVFRQIFNFQFDNFQLSLKPNFTYDDTTASHLYSNINNGKNASTTSASTTHDLKRKVSASNLKHRKKYKTWFKYQKALDTFFNNAIRKITRNRHGKETDEKDTSSVKNWRGLRRYVGDILDDKYHAMSIDTVEEYAKYSLVLDSASTRIIYYYDAPGLTPKSPTYESESKSPESGLDIELSMATIHYGPWADKQRIPIQNMLFPTLYRDSKPTELPVPGAFRAYKGFDVLVEVKDEVIFRIPTREQSKDLETLKNFQQRQQKKQTSYHHDHNINQDPDSLDKDIDSDAEESSQSPAGGPSRSFGWLELKMEAGSKISSHTSYIATKEHGWPNTLNVEFKSPELRSSVNHDVFFTADSHSITSKVGFPLEWNSKCNWEFHNVSENAKIFFLREHTMLLSDIFTDFASGSPALYEHFRPFHYQFNWRIDGYKLYLNINDSNIIDNPLDFSNNKYLSFQGEQLKAEIAIPLNGHFTKSNTIDYKISTTYFDLVLDTPPWHTTNAFMKQAKLMGKSHLFTINGSYTYFTSVEINTSDHIVIDMAGDYVILKCYGFVVKYLLTIRENYFGDHVHFKTFEEYSQEQKKEKETDFINDDEMDAESNQSVNSDFSYWSIGRTENDIDVLFMFKVRHGLLVLPTNIYDSTSHIGLRFDSLDVDIRFTNYYMDFQADLSPLSGVFIQSLSWEDESSDHRLISHVIFDIPLYTSKYLSKPDITIDGLSIHGHRMFGLPPVEPTYYCKWDIAAGDINIDSNGAFLNALGGAIAKLGLGYMDLENELIIHIPILYDITFFSFQCPSIHIGLNCDLNDATKSTTLNIDLYSITHTFNDLANDRYTSKVSLLIPLIKVYIETSANDKKNILAYLETSLNLTNICQKKGFLEHRRLQQEHVRTNDAPFHRCPFLLFPSGRDEEYSDAFGCFITSLSLPNVAQPLNSTSDEIISDDDDSVLNFDDDDDEDNYSSPTSPSSTSFNSRRSPGRMEPTSKYENADYCPDYEIDPDYEYDNFIVNVSTIEAFLSPKALLPIAKLLQSCQSYDLTSLMDNLQLDILITLKQLTDPESTVKNVRFVTQEINFKIGDFDVSDPQEVFDSSPKIPLLNISIIEPSLAVSVKSTKVVANDQIKESIELSSAVHIKEIACSISNPSDFTFAATLNLDNIEFWLTKNADENEVVASLAIDKLNKEISANQIEWLSIHLLNMYEIMEPSFQEFKKVADAKTKNLSELVYMVSKAGNEYHIDYDPGVLTKPAYILRSCTDHIRFHDSWKLMTRIRHVLDHLPLEWHRSLYESIKDYNWKTPSTAYEDVLSIFSRWRAWEIGDIQRSYFFQHIFPQSVENEFDADENLFANFKVDFGGVCLNVSDHTTNSVDFIDFQGIKFTLGIKDETNVDLLAFSGLGGILDFLQSSEGIFHIDSYKSKISQVALDLIPKMINIKKQYEEKHDSMSNAHDLTSIPENAAIPTPVPSGTENKNRCINLIANIESFQQQVILPYSSFEARGSSITVSSQAYLLSSTKIIPFTVSTRAENYSFDFWGENQVLSNSNNDFNYSFGNYGSLDGGVRYGKIKIRKISIIITEEDEVTLVDALESIIREDIPYLRNLSGQHESAVEVTTESAKIPESTTTTSEIPRSNDFKSIYKTLGDIYLEFELDEFIWSIDLFHQVNLYGNLRGNKFSINIIEEAFYLDTIIKKFDVSLNKQRRQILGFENADIRTNVKLTDCSKMYLTAVSIHLGFTKVIIPHVTKTLEQILGSLKPMEERIEALKRLFEDKESSSAKIVDSSDQSSLTSIAKKKFAFKVNMINDYVGVSSFLQTSKISFEVEGFSCGAFNVANIDTDNKLMEYFLVPVYGEVMLPTARISILDRSIPVGLSSILDVNMTLKVLNSIGDTDDGSQSLQFESQYCRICVSPQVLFKVIELVDQVQDTLMNFPYEPPTRKEKANETAPKTFSMPFSAINILSYNFCMGWLFGESGSKAYPGIIIGAERFFAVVEESVGKFTLMEAYLSVANGSRSSNFFSSSSEKNNLNRAYLPTMQCTFLIEQVGFAKHLRVHTFGDELDVKFLSDSIALVENAVKSGTKVQGFFNKRERPVSRAVSPQVATAKTEQEAKNDNNPLQAFFNCVECVYSFGGANILLYRLSDGETNSSSPSLFLHSPAVRVAAMYKHNKDVAVGSNEKKHTFKCEVLTSPSDNVVYASCVPVIQDIVQGVKRMVKNTSFEKAPSTPEPASLNKPVNTSSNSDFKFADFVKDLDLHFGLCIEKQKLSLSCEPTAKVEAIVGIGGIQFQVNTSSENDTSFECLLQFESISSSLQHVYSREVSGSIEIRNILLASKIDFADNMTEIVSTGSLSDVSGYVNIKQFQDLKLFKDIWIPSDLLDSTETGYGRTYDFNQRKEKIKAKDHISANKNLSSRFKEVSTTYAIPWDLTFMIINVSLQVDFGQSLGNFALNSKKIWAISNKTTDWAQDLKIGIDNISLISEGRLGGMLEIKNIFLHAAISWNIDGNILDVPLIMLTGDVKHLQLKSSFDYHVFALANIQACSIEIFNQKNEGAAISKDHLHITTKFETAEIYITSFAASNVMDIYNAIFRMVQENKNSYRETLRDSKRNKSVIAGNATDLMFSQSQTSNASKESGHGMSTEAKKLVSKIEVIAGHFLVHIYPSSFDDSKVLVVKLDGSKINFDESEYEEGIANDLQVQFNGLKVSLSKTSELSEDFVISSSVDQFVEHAHKARGGTIFVFPSFKISMKTFQKYNSNVIEYYYQSSFGGTVGIRWNLGSINFIREMYAIHMKALSSRTSYSEIQKRRELENDSEVKKKEKKLKEEVSLLEKPVTNENYDEAINATIDKVSQDSKYVYEALAEPIIEAPQLKELGNATPPLEWFGLHREKFPNVTHQLGIVSLQKFIHEIETQYSKVLGKA